MPLRRRARRVKLVRWPTPDWDYTPWGYRFLKRTLERPLRWMWDVRARGVENVPLDGPVLLVPNHFSWSDPFAIGVALKRPAFYLAKESLFRNPVLRAFLEAHGQIKVDRHKGGNDPAVEKACELLGQGLVVGVFPEATRSRPGEVKRGKTGVARIALQSGAPVVPVGMTTDATWPKGRMLPRFRAGTYVNFGPPFRPKADPELAKDRAYARDLTDEIMGRVRVLLAEAERARERGERWE